MAQTLDDRYDTFVHQGQVRHLPAPEYWERIFKPIPEDTYQNGGYWGTASGWMIEALRTVDPALAEKTFRELIASYREEGVLEWIAPGGRKGPDLYGINLRQESLASELPTTNVSLCRKAACGRIENIGDHRNESLS